MEVRDIMAKHIEVVRQETTVREAAERMDSLDIGALPVTEDSHLLGMITDRDIVIRVVAKGYAPDDTLVGDFMSVDVIHCFED